MTIRFFKLCSVILLFFALAGCSFTGGGDDVIQTETEAETEQPVALADTEDINSVHLRDKDLLYEGTDDTEVITMYLTVSRGNSAENTDHSWEEINTYSVYDYEDMGVDRYQVAGLLQVGDENGPAEGEVGYGETAPNATVQIRGQTSSRRSQKNYKIELKKNKGTWNGQRTINLNKHQGDGLRFRNHLVYKLLQGIPQLMSLRTQFVHLYVKDHTEGEEAEFEDYGLYTQVEQLNKTGLQAHGLDKNGHLYKINHFEFYRYEDVVRLETDSGYDLEAFEDLLEVKGDTDHTKLIAMLEDLNDHSIPIETVLETHFDEENLLYWMAFQILIGNVDTQSRNVYLYSPQNSDIWYLIAWDHDAALKNTESRVMKSLSERGWESGISNYWGNVLFQRCLKSDNFRLHLDDVIEELRLYLNEERLTELSQRYAEVVMPYLYSMPDEMYARLTEEEYNEVLEALPEEVEENYQLYLESLEKPMPFFIDVPEVTDQNTLRIAWAPSYDLDAENLVYTAEVSRQYTFEDVIFREENLILPEITLPLPEPGQYFVRVRVTNASGYTQDAFDYYMTDGEKQYGMKCFYIEADKTIVEDVYEE